MNIWILQTGEPLHIDDTNLRPMRAVNLSNKLVEAGHNVVLFSSAFSHQEKKHRSKKYKIYKISKSLEIRLIPSCGYKKHIGLKRLFDHFQLAWNLRKLLKEEKNIPDIAFIGYPPIETAFIMSAWLKVKEIPCVLDVKDLWPSMFVNAFPKIIRPLAKVIFYPYFYLAKKTINNVSGISAMAPAFLDWVLNFAKRKPNDNNMVFRLTSPIDEVSKLELSSAKKWWYRQGVDEKMHKFCFIGTFSTAFDFEQIYYTAKKLNNCQFILCGDGPCLDSTKLMMQDLNNVIFTGWIDRVKIKSLAKVSIASLAPYKNIDNFIFNTPNKIIDSLSLGLPILTPLEGEVANLIRKYKVGFNYKNAYELENSINALICDKKIQKNISNNAKKLYQNEFEFNKVYDDFVKYLEKMSNER